MPLATILPFQPIPVYTPCRETSDVHILFSPGISRGRPGVAGSRPIYCRMCGTCNGVCAKGVPVPDMLRFLSYAEGYGQFAMARERFLELPDHVRSIRCADCASCSVDCPNGVRVRERVARAQELFA